MQFPENLVLFEKRTLFDDQEKVLKSASYEGFAGKSSTFDEFGSILGHFGALIHDLAH